jgi:hypothetical protein
VAGVSTPEHALPGTGRRATSSADAGRPEPSRRSMAAKVSATPPAPSHRSVATGPGLIALARMPRGPNSFDTDFVKLTSAAFAAL